MLALLSETIQNPILSLLGPPSPKSKPLIKPNSIQTGLPVSTLAPTPTPTHSLLSALWPDLPRKSDHIILLTILHGSHLTMACKSLSLHHGPYHQFELLPNHPLPLAHSAPSTLASLLSLNLSRNIATSFAHAFWNVLPSTGHMVLPLTFGFLFKCHFLREAFPDHAQTLQAPLMHLLSLFPTSFLSVALITI